MGYMPQNIDSTTKTIGLWLLAHKDEKHITSFEVTQEFPNVAKSRVSNVLTRFCREGYLLRISRGFYRVNKDNVMDFERRLKPSAGEIEVVPAIAVNEFRLDIKLKRKPLNLNVLLALGAIDFESDQFITLLDYLDEYAKSILGMVKYARANVDSFGIDETQISEQDQAEANNFLKEFFE